VGVALVDHICSLQAVIGILAALRHREQTGAGQHVKVSLMGSALAALLNQGSGFAVAGVVPSRLGNRHPSIAPYQTFATGDGFLVLACGNDSQFARAATVAGVPDLATDPRFVTNSLRVANIEALDAALTSAFASRSAADLAAELSDIGVPAGTILDVGEAFSLAGKLGLDPIEEFDDGDGQIFRSVRSPIHLAETPVETRLAPPNLGEQGSEIRQWLDSLEE
jgi:crotonobetainyl-CoA:carnitine CoA-transferase CaiB-like acyl-CoA transferase